MSKTSDRGAPREIIQTVFTNCLGPLAHPTGEGNVLTCVVCAVVLQPLVYSSSEASSSQAYPTLPINVSRSLLKKLSWCFRRDRTRDGSREKNKTKKRKHW